jgi:Flp pilus assembly protein TadG
MRPSAERRASGDRGAALVEFALVLPFLAILVFGVVDLGRVWQLQNRLSNASREGAAALQFAPRNVDAACAGGNNANDRSRQEEPSLAAADGYGISVAKIAQPSGVATTYTGCGTTSPLVSLLPGEQVRVTARANFRLFTPIIGNLVGDPLIVRRSTDVVVQG